ncbi:LexA family transcriptional regulator [Paraburkholderia xenovorans]
MPAKPLTDIQLQDAARLRALFSEWQAAQKHAGNKSSQESAAEALGFGQSALSQYLRGKIPLNPEALAKFARLFNKPMSDISPSITEELRALGITPSEQHTARESDSSNTSSNAALFTDALQGNPSNLQHGKLDAEKLTDGRASVSVRPILAWDDAEELGEGYVLIPRLDVKFSAGNGRMVWHVDEKGQKQAFRKAWCIRLGINPDHAATIVNEGQSMEPRLIDGDSLVVDYKATQLVDGKVYAIAYQSELYIKRLFKRPGGGLLVRSDNPDKTRFPDMNLSAEDVQHVQVIARVMGVSGAV